MPFDVEHGNEFQQAVEILREYVRLNKLRYTREREQILRAVFELEDHFNVARVADRIRAQGTRISRTTIYRNMCHLVQAGVVSEVRCGSGTDEVTYEHVHHDQHHGHLSCVSCGAVVEFEEEAIEVLLRHIAEKRGFQLIHHSADLRGLCSLCAQKAESEPRVRGTAGGEVRS